MLGKEADVFSQYGEIREGYYRFLEVCGVVPDVDVFADTAPI